MNCQRGNSLEEKMTVFKLKEFVEELEEEGFDEEQVKVAKSVARNNLGQKTYNTAVHYLGLATILLGIGALYVAYHQPDGVSEALWGIIGAGVGGLSGIFMGRVKDSPTE